MISDLEARVSRKLMLRIIPFVMLLYFVSFLDRVNVGFAAMTMNKAIGLSPTAFGLGGGLFFIGYFLFEVPSNLILHKVGARLWIARVMVTWGIVSAASAFVIGPNTFYALRFVLGVAEAGFFPGIILYLSLWFPSRQRAVAAAWFMAAAPISTAIGSPLSGAIMQLPPMFGLADWQLLYILEAVPAVILGFVVLKYMTDTPSKAHWLQPDEREWLIAKLKAEADAKQSHAGHTAGALSALRDPRVLALALIYFGTSAGLYTLGLWAPLIIQQYGYGAFQTGLITGIPECPGGDRDDPLGQALGQNRRTNVACGHPVRRGVRRLHLRRPGHYCSRDHSCADHCQHRHQRCKSAAVGHAEHVSLGGRSRCRHCHDQLSWQPWWIRRSVRDRLA